MPKVYEMDWTPANKEPLTIERRCPVVDANGHKAYRAVRWVQGRAQLYGRPFEVVTYADGSEEEVPVA